MFDDILDLLPKDDNLYYWVFLKFFISKKEYKSLL
jgi:hypothetical protein